MVKHIYLVRHGETADNHRWIHQSIDVPLNARGKKEAEAAARALAAIPIDALLMSDAERTKETAAPIAAAIHVTPQLEPLLRELHRGILVEGEHHLSWRSIKGVLGMYLHAGDRSWRFGNGENILEFRERIQKILGLLAKMPGEHIVVVTHRGVINAIRFALAHGLAGSPRRLILAAGVEFLANGSITELTYDPSRTHAWHLERADDTRHLHGV
ncbi:MAG TPA: histidine phosphatase family protein [Candidatus Paceibacterota bacterium]